MTRNPSLIQEKNNYLEENLTVQEISNWSRFLGRKPSSINKQWFQLFSLSGNIIFNLKKYKKISYDSSFLNLLTISLSKELTLKILSSILCRVPNLEELYIKYGPENVQLINIPRIMMNLIFNCDIIKKIQLRYKKINKYLKDNDLEHLIIPIKHGMNIMDELYLSDPEYKKYKGILEDYVSIMTHKELVDVELAYELVDDAIQFWNEIEPITIYYTSNNISQE